MHRTEFGLTWDNSQPMDEELKQRIPVELYAGLTRYFEDCVEPGGFLRAVLENDLESACRRAAFQLKVEQPGILFDLGTLLYNWGPAVAWGNPDKVAAWLKRAEPEGSK